ncbi:MAG: ABC transporter substrate-binding protein [Pseudomonadota bacterium]
MINMIMRHLKSRLVLATLFAFACPVFSVHAENAHKPDGVTVCMSLEPTILDPTAGAGQVIREIVYGNIFEGLTAIDRDGKIVPRLAKRWDVSKDGLSYIFHLHEHALFHDGEKFTADDVKFSFERAMKPDSKNVEKWIFEPIEKIEVINPTTLKIILKYPSGLFLYGLGWGDAVIFSPKSAARNITNPVGTGPYVFKEWQRGNRLALVRNDEWREGQGQLGTAVFRFIPDPQAVVAALRTGECDLAPASIVPEQVEELKKNPDLDVTVGETEGETILAMNNGKAPFDDVRVRRALTHAIDRKAVIEGAMSGLATQIGSHFSPTHPAYVDLTNFASYDPEAARKLLAEAGHPKGFSATLSVPPMAYARRSAEIIAQMLAQVNVRVTLVPLEFPQWLDRVYKNKDYDLTIISHTEPLDIKIYARPDYYFQYRSERFQALMKEIFRTVDENTRNKLFMEAQKILADDAVNVFLFELPKITVARKGLQGVWRNWPLPVNPIAELSWQK